jgi:hypothetical protein
MMAEDRAARIVHRLLSPHSSWEQFERILVSQQRPHRQLALPHPARRGAIERAAARASRVRRRPRRIPALAQNRDLRDTRGTCTHG